jgi:hypothetical protein
LCAKGENIGLDRRHIAHTFHHERAREDFP